MHLNPLVPLFATIFATNLVVGQSASFDVVSVKPQLGRQFGGTRSGNRFYEPSAFLKQVIEFAYDLPPFRVVGGPDWLESDRWAIDARASAPVRPDEMRLMVRQLLRDRFSLNVHVESREQPRYELRLARKDGKLGPNLKPVVLDDISSANGARSTASSAVAPGVGGGTVIVRFQGVPLSVLAAHIEKVVRRGVRDNTGLVGFFDLELSYFHAGVTLPPPSLAQLANETESPALLTALREQLGLELESTRGPVDVLVIDSVQRPIPN